MMLQEVPCSEPSRKRIHLMQYQDGLKMIEKERGVLSTGTE